MLDLTLRSESTYIASTGWNDDIIKFKTVPFSFNLRQICQLQMKSRWQRDDKYGYWDWAGDGLHARLSRRTMVVWVLITIRLRLHFPNFIFHHGEKFNNLPAEKEKRKKCVWKSSASHFTISNAAEGNLIRTRFMRCLTPLPQHRVSRHRPPQLLHLSAGCVFVLLLSR